MKKTLAFIICLLTLSISGFAQATNNDPGAEFKMAQKVEQQKLTTQIITVPDGFIGLENKQYMSDEILNTGGTIVMEYSPLYNEVRITYTCMMQQYERGEAMNTVLAVLQDFLELTQYKSAEGETNSKERYYHYTYLVPDKEKYFRNERGFKLAQFISYLKFTK